MKILLTSIGTRGDVEPFLALGDMLQQQGHQVYFSFPEQFACLVNSGDRFYPLSRQVIELIESEEGKIIMGGKANPLKKLKALWYLYKEGSRINRLLVIQQFDIAAQIQPDKIIHNVKCSYATLWGMRQHKETILMSPVPYFMYYVKGHAHVGFKGNLGRLLNHISYRISNFGLLKTIDDAQKSLPEKHHFSKGEIRKELFSKKLLFAISPSLFERPANWPAHVHVTGYFGSKNRDDWKPDEQLSKFLQDHQKLLFLSFGSMTHQGTEDLSRFIYSVLCELKIPTVVNIAAGGLLPLKEYSQEVNLHFVKSVPYDWVMKRAYAVVHHGGSGTTHLGLKYGCPTLIFPHILDQFAWNSLVHQIGVGPKGVAVHKLNRRNLSRLLQDLIHEPSYRENAKRLSERMHQEKGKSKLMNLILEE